MSKRPSLNDITGNRAGNPNLETRHSSDATRNNSMADLFGNSDGNPFGAPRDYDFFAADDYADPIEDPVTHANSRLDLTYDLPSTVRQRFVAK